MNMEERLSSGDNFIFHGLGIPEYMAGGLHRYIDKHISGGSFLEAVLSNDLRASVENADDVNVHRIPVYIAYLYNHAPIGSYGSPEAYKKWTDTGGVSSES